MDTDDTASITSSEGGASEDEWGDSIRRKLNPAANTALKTTNNMQVLPPSIEMGLREQRQLQRRLEQHQARLAGGRGVPLYSRPPPRGMATSQSEPNTARGGRGGLRSLSAKVRERRSFSGSEFAIMRLPRFPGGGAGVSFGNGGKAVKVVNPGTGRVVGPPHSSRK